MSGQSAKRLGLEVEGDLELELRLRRIELALDKKTDANQDATQTGRGKGTVPQVTGLRVIGSTPGAATVGWNAVSISDLRRYELAFSTALSFAEGLQEYNEATTQYVFNTASDTGGGGGATWYVRVRAVNSSGQRGVWSVTLNLTTGQAQTEDLAAGSVTSEIISTTNAVAASQVSYDHTTSGLVASQVQAALDEILGKIVFTKSYASAQTALPTQNSFTDFTHGLGTVPKLISCYLVCTTADLDYSVNDQFHLGSSQGTGDHTGNANTWGYLGATIVSSTSVRIAYSLFNDTGLYIPLKDGTTMSPITDASWRIVVRAYA